MTLVAQVIAGYSLLQILIFVVIIAVVISIAHAILGRSCTAVLVLLPILTKSSLLPIDLVSGGPARMFENHGFDPATAVTSLNTPFPLGPVKQ